jgi:hypothetical protein
MRQQVIAHTNSQSNPDTLTRSFQVQGVGGEGQGERAQPFRLKGPAIETINSKPRSTRYTRKESAMKKLKKRQPQSNLSAQLCEGSRS